ncbi:MBL fold metallo-hydrolase [Streptomyces scabiei]|uniref:MBL fold metallo-hydrolase n=1 Tax=Streptomyces scabiei TaxID=1930 RepID=UPI0029B603A0|nr:MBL fold metallo-hydrolase [Streptomyces scabiei]MDX3165857.1 MBL fold metallo-hydrolase [Streptomyces scabiei]
MANCVLIASGSDALLVDTPYTAQLTHQLKTAAYQALPPSAEISTVVNTHANGDHSYGNGLFPGADIISTKANLEHLCVEPEPAQLEALLNQCRTDDPFGRYLLAHFGRYDYRGLRITPPTRTFTGRLEVPVGDLTVELLEVGPAHTAGDLIVHVPDSGVVCAGDVLFIDDVPVHWAGPLEGVVAACQQILDLHPRVVVPGHGPLVGPQEVRQYMEYVAEVRDRIHALHAQGLPVEAAAQVLLRERRDDLGLWERLAVLASTEYRHLDGISEPPQLVQVLSMAVRLAPECVPHSAPPRYAFPGQRAVSI